MAVTYWFSDGFDYYATAQIPQRWTGKDNDPAITATGGRRNGGYLGLLSYAATPGGVYKTFANYQDVIVQAAFKFPSVTPTPGPFLHLFDGTTTQFDLRMTATGNLYVTRAGTVLGTSTANFTDASPFHYVEIAAHIASGTAGWVIVRVNGVVWLNLTGISTQNTANAYVNKVYISEGTPGVNGKQFATLQIDDFLLRAGASLSGSDLLGDLGVTGLLPTADSTGANWAYGGAGIASHFDAVNDASPDSDTSYDESSTVGAEQRFVFGDVPAGVTVPGVEVVAYAKKTDAGARNLKFYVVTNSDTRYSDAIGLADTYSYYSWFWILNPVTGIAWTAAEVNAAEFGYRLDA